jgi:hypothetical protein
MMLPAFGMKGEFRAQSRRQNLAGDAKDAPQASAQVLQHTGVYFADR